MSKPQPRNGLYGVLDGMPVRLDRRKDRDFLLADTDDHWVPARRLRPLQVIRTRGTAFGEPIQVLEWRGEQAYVQLFSYQPWIEEYLGTYDRSDSTCLVTIPRTAVNDVHEDVRDYPYAHDWPRLRALARRWHLVP